MKIATICTLLALVFLFPLRAQPGGETVTVEVQGLGKDAQSAEKNALYQAVERAVGAYLDNETVIKNEEVIRDKLLTVAQGFVQSYDVLSPPKERHDGSGLWEIKIKAVVKKSEVGAALRSAGVMEVAADGTAAWAAQITKLKSREDAMALLEKVMPEIPRNLVLCSIVQDGAKIQAKEDPKSGDLLAIVTVRMDANLEWWSKEVVPALDAAFTALKLNDAKTSVPELSIYKTKENFEVQNILEDRRRYVPTNVSRFYENYLSYHPDDLRRLMPIKDFSLVSQEKIIVRKAVAGYDYSILPNDKDFRLNESEILLNVTQSNALLKFKKYSLPSDYVKSISQLIAKAFSEGRFGDGGVPRPAFTVVLVGENNNEILHRADFYFPETLQITDICPRFVPLFEFHGNLVASSRLTSQVVVQLELPVDAETLKKTKRIELLAGRYGVKKL